MAIDVEALRKLNPNRQVSVKVKDLLELAASKPAPKPRTKPKPTKEGDSGNSDD